MEEAGETLLSKEEMEASGLEPDQVINTQENFNEGETGFNIKLIRTK